METFRKGLSTIRPQAKSLEFSVQSDRRAPIKGRADDILTSNQGIEMDSKKERK